MDHPEYGLMIKMKRYLKIIVGVVVSLPVLAFAQTPTPDLLPLPSTWLNMIATSSVPFLTAMLPITLFLAGIGIVAWLISLLTGIGR